MSSSAARIGTMRTSAVVCSSSLSISRSLKAFDPAPRQLGLLARHDQAPSERAITICCTSSVPSPIVRILASR